MYSSAAVIFTCNSGARHRNLKNGHQASKLNGNALSQHHYVDTGASWVVKNLRRPRSNTPPDIEESWPWSARVPTRTEFTHSLHGRSAATTVALEYVAHVGAEKGVKMGR